MMAVYFTHQSAKFVRHIENRLMEGKAKTESSTKTTPPLSPLMYVSCEYPRFGPEFFRFKVCEKMTENAL